MDFSMKITTLLRLVVLVVSCLVIFLTINLEQALQHLRAIPPYVLFILVLIGLLRASLTGLRWQLLNPDDSKQLSSWQYFRLTMMSKPFNLIMPGALGGDFARTAMTLKTVQSRRGENLIAIVVDRYIGLFSITLLGVTSLFLVSEIPDRTPFYSLFGLLFAGFAFSFLIAASTRLMRVLEFGFTKLGRVGSVLLGLLETWEQALQYFRAHRARVLAALGLCLPIHGISFLTYYFLAIQLDMPVSLFDISAVVALVWVITSVPITIGGAGVRELSLIYLLGLYGISPESATALSIYVYVVGIVMAVLGVLVGVLGKGRGAHTS